MSSTVPEGWSARKLGEVTVQSKGLTYKSTDYGVENQGLPFLTLKSISKSGGYSPLGLKFFKSDFRPNHVIGNGDILFANTDLTRDGDVVGSPLYFDGFGFKTNPLYSMDLSKLEVNPEESHGKFLYYLLMTHRVKRFMVNASAGSTVLHLDTKRVKELPILLPPLPEQKNISSILTSVDEVIENTQKQINKLQDLKKATMNELLTKGIGHTEFKDSELGRIPKKWEVNNIGELSSKVGSGVTPRGGSLVYQGQGIVFIRSQNIHFDGLELNDVAYISEEIHASLLGSRVCGGDVLLNITGASIGRCTTVPESFAEANVNQHVCIIRPMRSLQNKFLSLWLSSDFGQDQIMKFQAGGNREGLNFQQIRLIKIPVPGIEEQKYIGQTNDVIQAFINDVSQKLHQTQSLKISLMQDLLTGKVRVKEN